MDVARGATGEEEEREREDPDEEEEEPAGGKVSDRGKGDR